MGGVGRKAVAHFEAARDLRHPRGKLVVHLLRGRCGAVSGRFRGGFDEVASTFAALSGQEGGVVADTNVWGGKRVLLPSQGVVRGRAGRPRVSCRLRVMSSFFSAGLSLLSVGTTMMEANRLLRLPSIFLNVLISIREREQI